MSLVSVGQAATNALAAWLEQTLGDDVTVMPGWPEPNVKLPPKAVSVIKVGKRERLDVIMAPSLGARVNLDANTAQIAFQLGAYMQPVQLDVWTTSDTDRDDLIARLDLALTAGRHETVPDIVDYDDPVSDGILLELQVTDGYSGTVEAWLDEPSIHDAADSATTAEYRATYYGEVRGVFSLLKRVPRMARQHLKLQLSEQGPVPTSTPIDSTTQKLNPSPPPTTKIVHP